MKDTRKDVFSQRTGIVTDEWFGEGNNIPFDYVVVDRGNEAEKWPTILDVDLV